MFQTEFLGSAGSPFARRTKLPKTYTERSGNRRMLSSAPLRVCLRKQKVASHVIHCMAFDTHVCMIHHITCLLFRASPIPNTLPRFASMKAPRNSVISMRKLSSRPGRILPPLNSNRIASDRSAPDQNGPLSKSTITTHPIESRSRQ